MFESSVKLVAVYVVVAFLHCPSLSQGQIFFVNVSSLALRLSFAAHVYSHRRRAIGEWHLWRPHGAGGAAGERHLGYSLQRRLELPRRQNNMQVNNSTRPCQCSMHELFTVLSTFT